jgi:uncharacterized membrane protein
VRVVRDRRDARWLPSRFHFALFRLYAYFRLRSSKPEPAPGLILSLDSHQSAAENFLVAACIVFVAGTYFAALFEASMPTPLAYAAGVPTSMVTIQGLIVVAGFLAAGVQRVTKISDATVTAGVSIAHMGLMIGAGLLVAFSDTSARYIARGFLSLVAMNALAAVVAFLLRGRMADEERKLGVER